jgi:hypothetical protein
MMSEEFTSDAKKKHAAAALEIIFAGPPKLEDVCLFDLDAGSGYALHWVDGTGVLAVQVSYELDLGNGEEDQATKVLAIKPEPCALMRVMVTCTDTHPAFPLLKYAETTKSPVVLAPIMTAVCATARMSVGEEAREIMFPSDDVQEVMYVGGTEGMGVASRMALGFYVVVPVTNVALIALKNKAATFLKSYLHIAAAHRIGPMAATLDAYRLKKG